MNFLYEKKTNLVYKYSAYRSRPPQIELSNNEIWILGHRFKISENEGPSTAEVRQRLERLLSSIAWFSYTKNFDPIPSDNSSLVITSDAGWGCMIRAGQMLLFALLMRMFSDEVDDEEAIQNLKYLLLKAYFREKIGKGDSKPRLFGLLGSQTAQPQPAKPLIENSELEEITQQNSENGHSNTNTFDGANYPSAQNDDTKLGKSNAWNIKDKKIRSDELGIFSLQTFSAKALELFQKPLGNWFRPTTFLLILKKLMKSHPDFSDFAVQNVVENVFYLKSLYKKEAFNATPEELAAIQTNEQCIFALSTRPWKRKVILSVTTLLGMDKTDPRYEPLLSRLMEMGSFMGMLGGYQQSAYYFVGKKSPSEYYYLDPHYVKPSLENLNDKGQLDRQYFDKTFLEINYAKMCSSVSIVFFLKNEKDFAELMSTLRALEESYKDDFFIAYFLEKEDERDLANDIISF